MIPTAGVRATRELGAAVRAARERSGMSRASLAAALGYRPRKDGGGGVSEQSLLRLETGKRTGEVGFDELRAIAKVIGTTVPAILSEAGMQTPMEAGMDLPLDDIAQALTRLASPEARAALREVTELVRLIRG